MFRITKPLEHGFVRRGQYVTALSRVPENDLKPEVRTLGIPDHFMDHAEVSSLHRQAGIDVAGIRNVLEHLGVTFDAVVAD
jgi:deoxyxylulose-5-phosphate synthase